jgi:Ca-activated chloride channel family protein
MNFANPQLLWLILAVVPILWLGRFRRKTVGHTQVDIHKNVRSTPFWAWVPPVLVTSFWVALCVGMAEPRQITYTDKQTVDAREFVIMVDTSGSMTTQLQDKSQQDFVKDQAAPGAVPAPDAKPATRATAARDGVKLFVDSRAQLIAQRGKGDRVSLLLFDDEVYTACPFVFDMSIISKKLFMIDGYQGGGTNFDGPNSDNQYSKVGAIQGAINYFKNKGQTKSRVLIMVTDGEDSISAKRFAELSQQIQDMGIHMYVLGVGESWTSGTEVDLRRFVEGVGGKVFLIGDVQAMRDGFAKINELETSKITIERFQGFKPLYWYFLIVGVILALAYRLACLLVREED